MGCSDHRSRQPASRRAARQRPRPRGSGSHRSQLIITMDTDMRPHAVDHRLPSLTRRDVLAAVGTGIGRQLRPLAAGFIAIADELAALMRWCACGQAPRFAVG